MTKLPSINIHGRDYVTVNTRVQEFHKLYTKGSITTEVISHEPVVVKATVIVEKGTYTGISAANPSKQIEKVSPYEVAETSAVGRALGFLGIGSNDSIASADEMNKAMPVTLYPNAQPKYEKLDDVDEIMGVDGSAPKSIKICKKGGEPITTAEYGFSMKRYGTPLCRTHQAGATPKK